MLPTQTKYLYRQDVSQAHSLKHCGISITTTIVKPESATKEKSTNFYFFHFFFSLCSNNYTSLPKVLKLFCLLHSIEKDPHSLKFLKILFICVPSWQWVLAKLYAQWRVITVIKLYKDTEMRTNFCWNFINIFHAEFLIWGLCISLLLPYLFDILLKLYFSTISLAK